MHKFADTASQKGFTLVPLSLYFKNGRAKVEIAIGKGKQLHDKRQALKTAEAKRDIERAMSRKRR
jgi:SsrA-binding protein